MKCIIISHVTTWQALGSVGDLHVIGSSFQTVKMVCKTKNNDLSLAPITHSY